MYIYLARVQDRLAAQQLLNIGLEQNSWTLNLARVQDPVSVDVSNYFPLGLPEAYDPSILHA